MQTMRFGLLLVRLHRGEKIPNNTRLLGTDELYPEICCWNLTRFKSSTAVPAFVRAAVAWRDKLLALTGLRAILKGKVTP